MKSTRVGIVNIVNRLDKDPSVIKTEILYQVVCVLERNSIRRMKVIPALVSTHFVVLEEIPFPFIMYLYIIANSGEIVEDLLLRVILVAVMFGAVLFKVGRELGICRIFTHFGCKGTKICDTEQKKAGFRGANRQNTMFYNLPIRSKTILKAKEFRSQNKKTTYHGDFYNSCR